MKRLTKQQKIFVSEYIKTLDGERSAKCAGYKSKNLTTTATELLSDETIIREIKTQLKQQISSLRVNKGYVIQKLLQIAEFSLEEEDILDKVNHTVIDRENKKNYYGTGNAAQIICDLIGE